ncbi:polyketide cyclase [Alistipes sp. OttesenSCG-928-L06]|nr:polyketide cyclase [Alistipes sp. OttesenSCG-928-L06]
MALEKYESKQVRINRPDYMIYNLLSDFNNFTPMLEGKVDNWRTDGDSCSFTVKGFTLSIRMVEKTPCSCIKIGGDEGSPFEFFFWIQLANVAPYDTRMKLTLHANLNMMMKMMLGKKLQEAMNTIADQIAMAFNMTPEQARQMAEQQGWKIPDSEWPMPEEPTDFAADSNDWPMPDPDKPAS